MKVDEVSHEVNGMCVNGKQLFSEGAKRGRENAMMKVHSNSRPLTVNGCWSQSSSLPFSSLVCLMGASSSSTVLSLHRSLQSMTSRH